MRILILSQFFEPEPVLMNGLLMSRPAEPPAGACSSTEVRTGPPLTWL